MLHYPYLIIGGGMAGVAAVRGIRKVDANGRIGIISHESHPPYKRPFLSKALWRGIRYNKVWMKIDMRQVDLHLSRSAISIDRSNRQVVDDQGETYSYDKLLLATGGTARRLPWEVDGLIYFRKLGDYLQLKSQAEHRHHFAVIGGGFTGSEIAAALSMNGNRVTMFFPEAGIGARILPKTLSHFLNTYYQGKGIEVLAGYAVTSIERHDDIYKIHTQAGKVLHVDGVVVGIGIQANTKVAQAAGLEVDNGIVVDKLLRSSDPAIYAAGDVANFFNPDLGKNIRVEHEDNANAMGEAAGRNMAGNPEPYHYLPFFYSNLFDLGYEAIGELDANMELIEDWQEPFRKGVVYYLKQGQVRGILLWNTWGHMDAARALISCHESVNAQKLMGRLG